MPRYELMYILSSAVSDDQVPETVAAIKQNIADFGGSEIEEQQLGKKKLAYPIKKTKNGYYVVETFSLPAEKIKELDAKIRTQNATIIRYLIVNLEEHLSRTAKDRVEQAKLSKLQAAGAEAKLTETAAARASKPPVEIDSAELDKKIEEALTEDLIK